MNKNIHPNTIQSLTIVLAALILLPVVAFAEIQMTVSVRPDFPDPRLAERPQLSYEDGFLMIQKIHESSTVDLVFEGKEIIQDSTNTTFKITKPGCYIIEEEGYFGAFDSNMICKEKDGTIIDHGNPFKNWVEKRKFFDMGNEIQLIVLPTQKDLRFASACPMNYSEALQACYRNVDDDKFIITSWETFSPFAIEHEMKHAECDCDFHSTG